MKIFFPNRQSWLQAATKRWNEKQTIGMLIMFYFWGFFTQPAKQEVLFCCMYYITVYHRIIQICFFQM